MKEQGARTLLDDEGIEYFWSRFGGWKFGRKDRDDDVSHGYASLTSLYREAHAHDEEITYLHSLAP